MNVSSVNPANTNHLYDICTVLDQRRRRWADVVQMLYKCFVFAGDGRGEHALFFLDDRRTQNVLFTHIRYTPPPRAMIHSRGPALPELMRMSRVLQQSHPQPSLPGDLEPSAIRPSPVTATHAIHVNMGVHCNVWSLFLNNSALESQKTVTAYFKSEQLQTF